ncbi:MAG TPA: hypothetical protein VGR87_04215 [Candidatus Limnocylindria bacterium]|jgi:hypothetical protein|nr:hypothetical protein [Candidatus Limnocylindria bacterium]
MRAALIAIAVVALIGIGTVEGLISAGQLSELPGRARPSLGAGGVALTLLGVALSAAVYGVLGAVLARSEARQAEAITSGVIAGCFAGFIGGGIRAFLVRDYLGSFFAGSPALVTLVTAALLVFVVLSAMVSVAAGGVFTWLGFRFGRPRSQRPPP